MRRFFSIGALSLFCLCASFFYLQKGSEKVALIVGISAYSDDSGWNPIHGENDIDLLVYALMSRGFERENILVLRGSEATKEAILRAFKRLSRRVEKGGFFVFHFSGHGQQVEDRFPEMDEADYLDEALVPYDARSQYQPGIYEGEQHLLDDELKRAILPLRKKLGKTGQLLLLIDACHSGTTIRSVDGLDTQPARGSQQAFTFPNTIETSLESRQNSAVDGFELGQELSNLAPGILISASRAGELNLECRVDDQYYGPLSFAFAQVFPRLEKTANYQLLFDQLQQEILALTDYQAPTIEGPLEKVVGQDKLMPVHQYFSTFNVQGMDLEVMAGQAHKVYEGSTFAFYPSVADTAKTMIATGKVVYANLFSAVVELDEHLTGTVSDIQRAYLLQQDFGDIQLRVALQIEHSHLKSLVQDNLRAFQSIQLVADHADLILLESGGLLEVIADGHSIAQWKVTSQLPDHFMRDLIENTLLRYAQTQFLANLNMQNPALKISLRIRPVEVRKDREGFIIQENPIPTDKIERNAAGHLLLPVGSYYGMEVQNEGTQNAYLSILDIQPNGDFSVAIPYGEPINGAWMQPQDYLLRPGQGLFLSGHYWKVGPPFGMEQYSVLATNTPIDLRKLELTKGESTLSGAHSLENLFQKTWQTTSKSQMGGIPPLIPTELHIEKVFAEIIEAR